jgi:hypothetical protein
MDRNLYKKVFLLAKETRNIKLQAILGQMVFPKDCGSEADRLFQLKRLKRTDPSLTALPCSERGNPTCFRHSRLCFLAEGGGKTRTVAIGDSFSQAALKPIHKDLMRLLRKIPMDCTFRQGSGPSFLKDMTSRKKHL